MGKKPDLVHKFSKGSAIQYLDLPKGKTIKKISDCQILLKEEKVKDVFVFSREGDVVSEITDSAKRVGCVIVQDADRQSVVETSEKTIENLANCFEYN